MASSIDLRIAVVIDRRQDSEPNLFGGWSLANHMSCDVAAMVPATQMVSVHIAGYMLGPRLESGTEMGMVRLVVLQTF